MRDLGLPIRHECLDNLKLFQRLKYVWLILIGRVIGLSYWIPKKEFYK